LSKKQTAILVILAFVAGIVMCTVSMATIFLLSFNHYKTSYEQALIEVERQELRLAND
jgi:uncharacterized protein YpmB